MKRGFIATDETKPLCTESAEEGPVQGIDDPLMYDAEQENIEIGPAELPVSLVYRHLPWPGHIKHLDDTLGKVGVGQFKESKDAL